MAGTKQVSPAYVRAQDAVLTLVRDEGLPPGARVPSERALAIQLGLSRMTVRHGLEKLVRAGVLERDSTTGTRVANVSVMRVIDTRRALSMSDLVRRSGARPGARLLAFELTRADAAMARQLKIRPGARIVLMRRLRTADGTPFCIETVHLPAALVPGLAAADLDHDVSLYALMRDRFGLRPTERDTEIGVGPIDADDARLLGLAEGVNVLLCHSVVYGPDGQPIESVSSVNHPQRVMFSSRSAEPMRPLAKA